jgi:hypothetical protein
LFNSYFCITVVDTVFFGGVAHISRLGVITSGSSSRPARTIAV